MSHVRRILVPILLVALVGGVAHASTQSELGEALQAKRPVFLVVTQSNARGTPQALDIAKKASALVPGSKVVTLDRAVEANAGLVKKYRVLGAPVPLVLVLAPNGIVAGGALLKDASPKKLAALVPTPKKTDMLGALEAKRAVILVFSHPKMADRSRILDVCGKAFTQMEQTRQKAQVIMVDTTDKAEGKFLAEMKVDPLATMPQVVVLNAKGEKTAVFREGVTVKQIVDAVNMKAPCCPGGSC